MTTNAFIFAWDNLGIESIVPITQYERVGIDNTMRILRDQAPVRNPVDDILRVILLRARVNTHRHYEVYAIDCAEEMDEEFWRQQWDEFPQETAELIRERGHQLFSDRAIPGRIKIT